ncbi:phage portal protein [Gemmobacter sp. LW-1]|uniref:phage portal protein n=1 Tax=Gemmobacter sp. LW-1 TaxID=1529005 RepID=UPI0006C7408F|nr:phage portal protein [Gemmobacter sp. LW-1]
MGLIQRIFGRSQEKRSSGTGYTAEIMAARSSYIAGRTGLADLTATAQTCVSMWEGCFALADVQGTDLLDRHSMALIGRTLALRGECVFLIREDRLVSCADWELSTRDGKPRAYRVSVSDVSGPRSETALAAEVLHLRIGSDHVAPWSGTPPLRRSSLTAGLLHTLETALAEVYENAPLGSQIVPFPEGSETSLETLGRSFRGRRGSVLLRESVNVTAAGGPAPAQDWASNDVTPDLSRSLATQSLEAARGSILAAFGVLPGMFASTAQGPLVREAQRHLAMWTLQPIAALLAEEASAKLAAPVQIDTLRPLQAFDVSGRARALMTLIEAMGRSKELGLSPAEVNTAMTMVNWGEGDNAA